MAVKHVTLSEYTRERSLAVELLKALHDCAVRHADAEYLAIYNECMGRQRTEDRRVMYAKVGMEA